MDTDRTCRIAGEAFSLVTGVDLSQAQLERPAPELVVTYFLGAPVTREHCVEVLTTAASGSACSPRIISVCWIRARRCSIRAHRRGGSGG